MSAAEMLHRIAQIEAQLGEKPKRAPAKKKPVRPPRQTATLPNGKYLFVYGFCR